MKPRTPREHVLRILKNETQIASRPNDMAVRISLTWEDFPVPGLVLIALGTILGHDHYGPEEKMAWGLNAVYADIPFTVQFEKFGLRVYTYKNVHSEFHREIVRALKALCIVAENYLKAEIDAQLNAGNVTIKNCYHQFESAYLFFRASAKNAYSSNEASTAPFFLSQSLREGGYLASAMLDAYFSKLEHLLVLLLAFSSFNPCNMNLRQFVGARWDEKFKTIFFSDSDRSAKRIYDKLKQIKEDIRNPASHGGFLKNGASFLFHSRAGALPVQLTKSKRGLEFHITPIPPSTYDEVCAVLDETDAFFRSSPLALGFRYIASGLDVSFSADSRLEYMRSVQATDIEALIEKHAYLADMHANMDY